VDDAEIEATAQLIYETGLLKLAKRTGWWLCGVKDPESIAEHSFRTAIIAELELLHDAGNDAHREVDQEQ
jgi:putative hydrolase of HD superfamily